MNCFKLSRLYLLVMPIKNHRVSLQDSSEETACSLNTMVCALKNNVRRRRGKLIPSYAFETETLFLFYFKNRKSCA